MSKWAVCWIGAAVMWAGCEEKPAPSFGAGTAVPMAGDGDSAVFAQPTGDGDGLAMGDGDTAGDGDSAMPQGGMAAPPAAAGPQVQVAQGTVQGFMSEGVRAFTGIPFGETTAGDNRWAAPKPAPAFTGVFEATEYAPPCAQFNATGAAFDMASDEDCLGINVWAPAGAAAGSLPVMVWIYGGAYQFGSGGEPYNGESLVNAGNVVVVSFNYRLAATGFMAHPAITAEAQAAGAPPANFGLQDQQLALRWIQDNISAFGGDPANVTVFGESAGANSICMHMAAPSSQGLFQRAIIESGLCLKPMLTLAQAEAKGARYAELMGCTGEPAAVLACLRQIPVEMVLAGPEGGPAETPGGLFYQDATQQLGFQPIVDGTLVPESPADLFAAGQFGGVSAVLHGAMTDEGALFHVPPLGGLQPMTDAEYEAALATRFGDQAAAVLAAYPAADYPSHADALSAVTGDAIFRCPAIRMADMLRAGGVSNYLYRFDLALETPFEGLEGSAFHSADIPYVFGNSYVLGMVPAGAEASSMAVQGYWTRFAATGDPNGGQALAWPAFDESKGYLDITTPIATGTDWAADGCGVWDGIDIVPF